MHIAYNLGHRVAGVQGLGLRAFGAQDVSDVSGSGLYGSGCSRR